jgi:hypothetical protein
MKGVEYTLTYVLETNTIFDLSSNHLTGEIPTSIGNMRSMRLLNLSQNQLEGKIPASLSEISTLEQLDLANNNLSGEIPQELSQLSMLGVLDISSNNLCGLIPTGTQFSTFNVTSFERNSCLHGCPLDPCNAMERQVKEGNNNSKSSNIKVGWMNNVDEHISLIALGVGVGLGFGIVMGIIIVWKRARDWVVPSNKPQSFYGVYRFPT